MLGSDEPMNDRFAQRGEAPENAGPPHGDGEVIVASEVCCGGHGPHHCRRLFGVFSCRGWMNKELDGAQSPVATKAAEEPSGEREGRGFEYHGRDAETLRLAVGKVLVDAFDDVGVETVDDAHPYPEQRGHRSVPHDGAPAAFDDLLHIQVGRVVPEPQTARAPHNQFDSLGMDPPASRFCIDTARAR